MESLKNKYYFEALDNYPYSLPDCLEALNYALSYNPNDADALCLMGRVYSEEIKDYETAKYYFAEAMANNLYNVNTPKYYVQCLLDNEDLEEAKRLIDFSKKLKGIDKAYLYHLESHYYERKKEYKTAIEILKSAFEFIYDNDTKEWYEKRIDFVKSKMSENKEKDKKSKKMKKKETN